MQTSDIIRLILRIPHLQCLFHQLAVQAPQAPRQDAPLNYLIKCPN